MISPATRKDGEKDRKSAHATLVAAKEIGVRRLERSEGRVKRIRKIHGRSQVPLRQPMIARASVSMATLCGVFVTGLFDTQLQQSRSQVASCMAKHLNGKNVTMVLMAAGNEMDPVHNAIALGVVGQCDAACHHGQVRPGCAACMSSLTVRDLGPPSTNFSAWPS